MQKIFNWTVGSFFRTIGRTIALFVMAGIIYYLLASSGIDIKNLFLDDVKALTITDTVQTSGAGYLTVGNNEWTVESDFYKRTIYSNDSIQYLQFVFNQTIDMTGHNYVEFRQIVSNAMTITSTDSSNIYRCTEWSCTDTLGGQCVEYTCTHTNYTTTTNTDIYQNYLTGLNVSYRIVDSNGNWNSCNLSEDTIVCPVSGSGQFVRLELFVNFKNFPTTNFQLALSRGYILYKSASGQIINSIDSQTQQQQQQHQEMMDSNTTQAESEASNFFGNFTQSDHGGLNSIVTAPLNTIQSLLSNSCTNLVLPLPFVNENITLPCMNDIYTTHFGLFFSLYQTIILAIISYRCIRSIFFDIHGFTDPDDDRIEVMDL